MVVITATIAIVVGFTIVTASLLLCYDVDDVTEEGSLIVWLRHTIGYHFHDSRRFARLQ